MGWVPRAGRACVLGRHCSGGGLPLLPAPGPPTLGEPRRAQPCPTSLPHLPRQPVVPQRPWAPRSHPSGSPFPTCSLRPLAQEGACGLGRRRGSWVGSGCVLLGPDGCPPACLLGEPTVQLEAACWAGGGTCSLSARACVASQTQALGGGLQGSPGPWCPAFSSLICEPRTRVSLQGAGPRRSSWEHSPLTTLTFG